MPSSVTRKRGENGSRPGSQSASRRIIQHAFEELDRAAAEARILVKERKKNSEKRWQSLLIVALL